MYVMYSLMKLIFMWFRINSHICWILLSNERSNFQSVRWIHEEKVLQTIPQSHQKKRTITTIEA